jgi:hypothetical protein
MKTTQETKITQENIIDQETILSAKHEIARAAEDAIKTIATAAGEAAKVVATATASAAKLVENKTAGDHDKIVELLVKMEDLKCSVNEINGSLNARFVSRDEFNPVRSIVYGLVGTSLLAVVGALLALVVSR